MENWGPLLAAAAAAMMTVIGALAVLAPRSSSKQYGVPTLDEGALAFVRGCGVRDIGLGLVAAVLVRAHSPALPLALVAIGGVAVGDLLIVGFHRPSRSLLLHAGGVLGLWFIAFLSWKGL